MEMGVKKDLFTLTAETMAGFSTEPGLNQLPYGVISRL
jgi:hypothetical protein